MLSEPIDSEAIIPGCIASKYDILLVIKKCFIQIQITWRGEIKEQFEKMKNRSSAHMQNLHQLQQLDEELIRRRKEELR